VAPVPLADHPSFTRFWAAATVSDFGTYITTLALQILIVVTLHGTAADVGWVSAARWLPYVLMGLVAGMFVDRWDRRRTLIGTDVVRGLLLFAVGGLGAAGVLSVPTLVLLIATFGLLSLFNDVAYQSFVPHLVPRVLLTHANARLEQSGAVAQTTGPALAGAIIGWIGAPGAFFVDAVSHLIAAPRDVDRSAGAARADDDARRRRTTAGLAGSGGRRSPLGLPAPAPRAARGHRPRLVPVQRDDGDGLRRLRDQRPGLHPVRPRRDARVRRNRQRRRQPAVLPGR